MERVAGDLSSALHRLYPEALQDSNETREEISSPDICGKNLPLVSRQEGYIQAIDYEGLLSFAVEENISLFVAKRPGDFISKGVPLAYIINFAGEGDDRLDRLYNQMVIVGCRRTPRQDFECALGELVEVAVRSLSPGINDPFTAIQCVDRLGAILRELAGKKYPEDLLRDRGGIVRIQRRSVTFPAALDSAFRQIRQNASTSVPVLIRVLEALLTIAESAEREADKGALREQAEMVWRAAQHISEPKDLINVKNRLEKLRSIL
ncbi:DUF2254 domain-containing protein [bacterium]|nr:DUF2254 domain-containing protein [bacterium]